MLVLIIILLFTSCPADSTTEQKELLNVYFLNVGHGDATVIKYKQHFILIDRGNSTMSYVGESEYKFLTKELGCKQIDMIIIPAVLCVHMFQFSLYFPHFALKEAVYYGMI